MNRASWWQEETDEKIAQMRDDYAREKRRARVVQWAIIVVTMGVAAAVVIGFALS